MKVFPYLILLNKKSILLFKIFNVTLIEIPYNDVTIIPDLHAYK